MRIVSAYMTENDCDWLELSIKSIIDYVDKVYIIYSKSEGDNTLKMLKQFGDKIEVTISEYPHDSLGADGIQRNKYLNILKEKELGSWCLVLDSDEIVQDMLHIKKILNECEKKNVKFLNPKMRHLIGNFSKEDATLETHHVPVRLFKVSKDLFYPEIEHTVLRNKENDFSYNLDTLTVWHFGNAKWTLELRNKFKTQLKKSKMHSPDFLKEWYISHLFGTYPSKEIEVCELPEQIKDYFELKEASELIYFTNRKNLEFKHFIDAVHWKDHFKPNKVMLLGCGMGQRLFCLNELGIDTYGIEISKYAIENTPFKKYQIKMFNGDITKIDAKLKLQLDYDLMVGYDVLEHLRYEDIDKTLKAVYNLGSKNFLFSVPFLGSNDLDNDTTHIIKETKEWWLNKFKKHKFKQAETPSHFLFKDQLFIYTK